MKDSAKTLLSLYRTMVTIRRFENMAMEYFAAGQIPGFIHLSIGQEASAVGVCSALRKDDSCIQRHRGHLGVTVTYLEKELPMTVAPGSILAATVSGYKGLEAEVVILTDMPDLTAGERTWNKSMWYVGITRCTTKLFAIVRNEFLKHRFSD